MRVTIRLPRITISRGVSERQLQTSVLSEVKTRSSESLANNEAETESLRNLQAKIDVNCEEPPGAAVGAFPSGDPSLCIAEQVGRNYPQWNYIVNNKLNTRAGLKATCEKSSTVEMPTDSIAIMADWVPVPALLKWLPQLNDVANVQENIWKNDGRYKLFMPH